MSFHPTIVLSGIAAILFLVPNPHAIAQESDKSGRAANPPPAVSAEPCARFLESARAFFAGLPKDLGSLRGSAADEMAVRATEVVEGGVRFDTDCSGLAPELRGEADYFRAKALHLLSERRRWELMAQLKGEGVPDVGAGVRQKMRIYFADVAELARRAVDSIPKESPLGSDALKLLGQAAGDGDDHQTALGAYQKFLELYPTDPECDRIWTALLRVYLELGSYDEGLALARQVMKDHYGSSQYPNYLELLWKLEEAKGDLAGLLEVVKIIETTFPVKLSSTTLGERDRATLEGAISIAGFRKGYVLFAKGDYAGAIAALKSNIERIDTRKNAAQTGPAEDVYGTRSRDNLQFLETLAGKPYPAELECGDLWLGPSRLRLADPKGKVVGIVFRGIGDPRSIDFVGKLGQLARARPDFALAVIAYLREGENIDRQMDTHREELAKVGYEGPAAFDPDAKDKKLFRAYKAYVGSATFVLVNPRGEMSWFMQDPRDIHEAFVRSIIDRASAEKAPEGAQPPASKTEPAASEPKAAPTSPPEAPRTPAEGGRNASEGPGPWIIALAVAAVLGITALVAFLLRRRPAPKA